MNLATVLSVAVAVLFAATGTVKLVSLPASLRIRDHLGLSAGLWKVTGALEIAGALGMLVGLWLPPLGVAAAGCLAALMTGAVVSRLRVRDSPPMIVGDLVVIAFVVATLAALIPAI